MVMAPTAQPFSCPGSATGGGLQEGGLSFHSYVSDGEEELMFVFGAE